MYRGAIGRSASRKFSWTFAKPDRKSTRLNSSHQIISYAVFCLKKKKNTSELQSQQEISYAVFCLKKKTKKQKGLALHQGRRGMTMTTHMREPAYIYMRQQYAE